jgi:hypothetical protein
MESQTKIQYCGFWSSFYTEDKSSFNKFFANLFVDIPRRVRIHSVFDCNVATITDDDVVDVNYSGEVYSNIPELYDLNLIMQETDIARRIVYLPLFALGSYELDLWNRYMQQRPLLPKCGFCSFVVSNPKAPLRNAIFQLLSQYKRVDSWGAVFNNQGGQFAPRDNDEYFAFLNRYKFMICFENASNPWYITEKLYNAWLGGTIPIYWGCTRVQQLLNPKAFLYLENDSIDAINRLIQRVIELDNDTAQYEAMFNEPLLRDGIIPAEFDVNNIRNKIRQVLIGSAS